MHQRTGSNQGSKKYSVETKIYTTEIIITCSSLLGFVADLEADLHFHTGQQFVNLLSLA